MKPKLLDLFCCEGGASMGYSRAGFYVYGVDLFGGYTPGKHVREALLGIDWMTQDGLSQSIPPAYSEWIGAQVIEHLQERAA